MICAAKYRLVWQP